MSLARRVFWGSIPLLLIAPALTYSCRIVRSDLIFSDAHSVANLTRAIAYDSGNGQVYWFRGRLKHYTLETQDLAGAIADYERALQLNPRLGQAWVDLADAAGRTGDSARAEACLEQALRVWAFSPSVHWQAGNWHLLRGNLAKMYEFFGKAVTYDISRLDIALETAWKVDPDRSEILTKLVPDNLAANLRCLNFLVAHKELVLARAAWNRCLRNPAHGAAAFTPSMSFSYIDGLLAAKMSGEAARVWREALGKSGTASATMAGSSTNLIWNGSFELAPLGGGFDWRRFDGEDFDLKAQEDPDARGGRSLRLTFHGTNVDFLHLYQIAHVPDAGNYRLEYRLRTEGLTSDQKPRLIVQGFPDVESTLVETESFPASSPWRKYSFPFSVDQDSCAVRLALRRVRSGKLDNRIHGSVWLDDISILPSAARGPERRTP